jgi:hypothetical protein
MRDRATTPVQQLADIPTFCRCLKLFPTRKNHETGSYSGLNASIRQRPVWNALQHALGNKLCRWNGRRLQDSGVAELFCFYPRKREHSRPEINGESTRARMNQPRPERPRVFAAIATTTQSIRQRSSSSICRFYSPAGAKPTIKSKNNDECRIGRIWLLGLGFPD